MKIINLRRSFTRGYDACFELIYPRLQICGLCGSYILPKDAGAYGVCRECYQNWIFQRERGRPCPRCGFFRHEGPCRGPCQVEMFNLSGIIAAAPHIGVYRQAVQALKYDGCSNLAEPLGFLMGEALIASRGLFPSCICSPSGGLPWLVPIPMHRDKELQRGYNQSRLLADRLGHSLRLKVKELLYRDKPGLTQAGLNKHQRLAALSEVFSCRTNAKPNNNCRKPLIILVDDVVTTGATLACCAGILRRVGYQQVIGLTFTAGSNQVIGQSKKM